jgi:hypothetical protein
LLLQLAAASCYYTLLNGSGCTGDRFTPLGDGVRS